MEGGAGATRRWLRQWSTCVYIALAALSFSPGAVALKGGNATDNYSCYVAPAVPEDRRVNKTRLRIVTYNAEWLFLDQGKHCPGADCPWHSEAMARQHADAVADVLRSLDADVINLCEVQGCDELDYLKAALPGMGYMSYLVKGGDGATGQNVGLLTRVDPSTDLVRSHATAPYPLPGSTCRAPPPGNGHTHHRRHRPHLDAQEHQGGGQGQEEGTHPHSEGGEHGCSKHYYTTLTLPLLSSQEGGGGVLKLGLVGAHLLARPQDPQRCEQREAQASVLRGIVEMLMQTGHEVVVLGDLNDFDADVADINANRPTSHVLSILKYGQLSPPLPPPPLAPISTNLTAIKPQPTYLRARRPPKIPPALLSNGSNGANGANGLWNVAAAVEPQSLRYTDWWDMNGDCTVQPSELSLIDHLLLSPGLRPRVTNVSIDNSAYRQYCGTNESDHWPIVVDIDLSMALTPLPVPESVAQAPITAAAPPL